MATRRINFPFARRVQRATPNTNRSPDALSTVVNSLIQGLMRPMFLLSVMFVAFVWMTHAEDLTSGFLHEWSKNHPNNLVLKWIMNNHKRFYGFLVFTPVVVDAIPRTRLFILAMTVFWIFVIPAAPIWHYMIHAIIIHLIFRVPRPDSRIFLIATAVALYFMEIIVIKHTSSNPSGGVTPTPST